VKWQVGVLGLLKWNEAPSELLSPIPASTVRYPQFNHTSSKAPQKRKKKEGLSDVSQVAFVIM